MKTRIENDIIGNREIPAEALYGINSFRAVENFPHISRFNPNWYKALGTVKLSYFRLYKKFKSAAYNGFNDKFPFIDDNIIEALIIAAEEISDGMHYDQFIVPAISGGAGTSINMNINEILANSALLKMGADVGDYDKCSPLEHANIFQSTNDVVPSSLKIATLTQLNLLEDSINELRNRFEILEKEFSGSLRIGYTQLQEAVPTTFGKLFSTYSDALSRDWWRVSKCFERIKILNLGGSAIGTSIAVPKYFVLNIVQELKEITDLPVARSENLSDSTSNQDSFVEIHAIIKAHAVNLEKIISDLRLLSSDIGGNKIQIKKVQQGSSVMPGKVNPVIAEYVISCCRKVYSNDSLITDLAAMGTLELNAYLPLIGDALLNSIELLNTCNQTIKNNLLKGIKINTKVAYSELIQSSAIVTALIPYIGYKKAEAIAIEMQQSSSTIFQANDKLKIIDDKKLRKSLETSNLIKEGFSLKEI